MENSGYITKEKENQNKKNKKETFENKYEKNKKHQKHKEKKEKEKPKKKSNKKYKTHHNPQKRKKNLETNDNNEDNKDANLRSKRRHTNKQKVNKYLNNLFTIIRETENNELNKRDNKKYRTHLNRESNHLKKSIGENNNKDNEEHLILINAYNNIDNYIPPNSNYNLDNYNYDEAILYEKRSYPRIFFIFLMNTEKILNTFVYKQPLELKPLRICMFLFNISCDIALNAFFYLSDNISNKYHYKGTNQFLFSLTNNLTISVVSAIIGFILIFFFQNLVQSTNKIKKLFKHEEDLMKQNKKYKVNKDKKMEIKKKIKDILKCLKIKIIIFFSIELILMLFFLYYITTF